MRSLVSVTSDPELPVCSSPPGRYRGRPLQRPHPPLPPAGVGPGRRLQPDVPLGAARHRLPAPPAGLVLLQPGHVEHLAGRHRPDPGHRRRRGAGLPHQPPPGPAAGRRAGPAAARRARPWLRPGGRGAAAAGPGRAGAGGHAGAHEGRHAAAGVPGGRRARRRRQEGPAAHGGGAAVPLHRVRRRGLQRAVPGAAALQLDSALLIGRPVGYPHRTLGS